MTLEKVIRTDWYPDQKLITTQISGDVDKADIEQWEYSLTNTLSQLEDNSTFKIFINLYGFKAIDIDAHKRFRSIVPLTLAQYGWKVGYVDLFEEEAKNLTYSNTRGIQCTAAVHVHQDASKIDQYEARFGREEEHFFSDPIKADQWIRSFKLN